jgi:hypothetical protein
MKLLFFYYGELNLYLDRIARIASLSRKRRHPIRNRLCIVELDATTRVTDDGSPHEPGRRCW